jgi:glycosyltransferase involved in cell wall biosynthesis
LFVGGRAHYKNFARLLEAYAGWERRFEVALVCVGAPWQPDEQRRLQMLGLIGSVQLLDHVDDEQLCRLYNRALALVHPSLAEGLGIPLLEAMACGCPIVASDTPATREVAGETPIYFDPLDATACRRALDQIGLERRQSVRVDQGLRRAAQFSWERASRDTLQVYREAMKPVEQQAHD